MHSKRIAPNAGPKWYYQLLEIMPCEAAGALIS